MLGELLKKKTDNEDLEWSCWFWGMVYSLVEV